MQIGGCILTSAECEDSRIQQSFNEIEALVRKAARGVGFSWGVAQEAAQATRWLEESFAQGLPEITRLLSLLDGRDHSQYAIESCSSSWESRDSYLCPVMTGVSLMDFCHVWSRLTPLTINRLHFPILLLPYASRVSKTLNQPLSLSFGASEYHITDGELSGSISPGWPDFADKLTIKMDNVDNQKIDHGFVRQKATDVASREHPIACLVDRAKYDTLMRYAHRTYAPSTEQSRRLGAGDES